MSDHDAHLNQAKHNEQLASELAVSLKYKDWLITVSFYSALHFIEAKLAIMSPPKHSDTSIPVDKDGKDRCSVHAWREELIKTHFKSIYRNYRKLRIDSQIARYLTTSRRSYLPKSVQDYFEDSYARERFNTDLKEIKTKLDY